MVLVLSYFNHHLAVIKMLFNLSFRCFHDIIIVEDVADSVVSRSLVYLIYYLVVIVMLWWYS